MSDITWSNCRVKLGDLKPWSENPRQSTKAQARRILKSFEQFGQAALVCVDPDNNVLDGHQRLSALLTVHGPGYEIEARRSSRPLTDDERRGLVLALANATGSWNWDMLSSWNIPTLMEWGFDKETLGGWGKDYSNLKGMLESEYIPETSPEIGKISNTDDDIETARDEIGAKFKEDLDYLEVACPKCGEVFYLRRSELK